MKLKEGLRATQKNERVPLPPSTRLNKASVGEPIRLQPRRRSVEQSAIDSNKKPAGTPVKPKETVIATVKIEKVLSPSQNEAVDEQFENKRNRFVEGQSKIENKEHHQESGASSSTSQDPHSKLRQELSEKQGARLRQQ